MVPILAENRQPIYHISHGKTPTIPPLSNSAPNFEERSKKESLLLGWAWSGMNREGCLYGWIENELMPYEK